MGLKKKLFGKSSKAPKAPDMKQEVAASQGAAAYAYGMSPEQQRWAQDQYAQTMDQLRRVESQQMGIADELRGWGQRDRAFYDQYGRPLERQLARDAQTYGTQARQDLEAGRQQAAVQAAVEANRANAQRNLESYGIDPSQTRAQALDLGARTDAAAAQVAAGNMGRQQVEQTGRALREAAIATGQRAAAPAAGQVAQGVNIGSATLANRNQATALGAQTMGTGMGWQSQGLGATAQAGNLKSQNFQNKLGAYEAEAVHGGGLMGGLGALGGQVLGQWAGTGFATNFQEGGSVPDDGAQAPGPEDTIPAMLAEGEYVIPREVVERKGTEFFDRLKEKTLKEIEEKKGNNAPPADGVQGFQNGGEVQAIPVTVPGGDQQQVPMGAIPYQQQVQMPERPQQQPQQQGGGGGGMPAGIMNKVMGGTGATDATAAAAGTGTGTGTGAGAGATGAAAGSGGMGSALAAAGPWAALAAAIYANKDKMGKAGDFVGEVDPTKQIKKSTDVTAKALKKSTKQLGKLFKF